MTADAVLSARKPLTPGQALLFGGMAVGVLDLLDALIFFGARGAAPTAILHAIASGLLGREAFSGGTATAALGLVLHFVIAFSIVAVYLAASRQLPVLARRPLLCGPLYGVAVYVVMNTIVVPLSAAASGAPIWARPWPILANGLLIHMIGVGLPAALAARATLPSQTS